jgi:hypothetical protein
VYLLEKGLVEELPLFGMGYAFSRVWHAPQKENAL